jgi:hypothetical protein
MATFHCVCTGVRMQQILQPSVTGTYQTNDLSVGYESQLRGSKSKSPQSLGLAPTHCDFLRLGTLSSYRTNDRRDFLTMRLWHMAAHIPASSLNGLAGIF